MGPTYSASSVGVPDGGGSHAARHSSMLGGSQEADVGGYRTHPPATAHYGGQYSSVYGLAALSSAQQVSGLPFFFSSLIVNYVISTQQNCFLTVLLAVALCQFNHPIFLECLIGFFVLLSKKMILIGIGVAQVHRKYT